MNAPPLIGAAVAAVAAGAVATFQETIGAGNERRPVGEIVTIIAAVGTLAGIIGGIIVQVVTIRIKAAVAPVVASVAEVATKTEVIQKSVDGTASRMESTLAASLQENKRLVALLGTQKQEQVAAVLAATHAQAPAVPGAAAPVVAAVIKDLHSVHEQIEENTRETAKAVKNLEPGGPDKR